MLIFYIYTPHLYIKTEPIVKVMPYSKARIVYSRAYPVYCDNGFEEENYQN